MLYIQYTIWRNANGTEHIYNSQCNPEHSYIYTDVMQLDQGTSIYEACMHAQ